MYNKRKELYRSHKSSATYRGIPFLLTFDDWCDIWDTSGHWDERGNRSGQYCMSRPNDIGPYAIGNVFIQLHSKNIRDAHKGVSTGPSKKRGIPISDETKEKLRIANLGKKLSEETKRKISAKSIEKGANSPESYARGWETRRAKGKTCQM